MINRFSRLFALSVCLLMPSVVMADDAPAKVAEVDFTHDMVPILRARCGKCHTNGVAKGDFAMDTKVSFLKSDAISPGKAMESELIERIKSNEKDFKMPPEGPRLSAKDVATLTSWINQGVPWEPSFSFRQSTYEPPLKPRKVTLPVAQAGFEHPIDRIVKQYWDQNKQSPPPVVDDLAFIRRVYMDLVGLLPPSLEVERFLSDADPSKRALLVRRLLDDRPAYADHWLSFWNDLLRNDYKGTGFIDGGRRPISRWLYQSLLDNKPYDTFVHELISPTKESEGFVYGIQWRGRVNASQVRELQFAQNVGQVFFGANLKCASCHDSFVDQWKLDDAYGLAAIVADKPLEINRCDNPTGRMAQARFLFPELGSIDPKASKEERLRQTADLVVHPDNGRFRRTIVNRIWLKMFGHGLVHPVDAMGTPPWSADLLDYLANYLVDQRHDLKALTAHIATSRAYQSACSPHSENVAVEDYKFIGPELKRLTAEQFIDALWTITGTSPEKPVAPVTQVAVAQDSPTKGPKVRASLMDCDALQRSLGRPNREQVVTQRGELLTTLQALDLANGQRVSDLLKTGATKILADQKGQPVDKIIDKLFEGALSRLPKPAERGTAREILTDTPTPDTVADLIWVVIMLPEFQLVR
ncbi:MAG: DUF1549 domain-containing protein [Planctomycetota bacterium]|nr:DUF1549 domain-containing protein [Planctomycetota bacterium]